MRLNLYTAAVCSILAYGIDAINLSSTLDTSAVLDDNSPDDLLAQTYMDEYAHDLAQTYSDLETSNFTQKSDSKTLDKHDKKQLDEVTKCAKIPTKKTDIKLKVPKAPKLKIRSRSSCCGSC